MVIKRAVWSPVRNLDPQQLVVVAMPIQTVIHRHPKGAVLVGPPQSWKKVHARRTARVELKLGIETIWRGDRGRAVGVVWRHHKLVYVEVPQLRNLTVLLVGYVDGLRTAAVGLVIGAVDILIGGGRRWVRRMVEYAVKAVLQLQLRMRMILLLAQEMRKHRTGLGAVRLLSIRMRAQCRRKQREVHGVRQDLQHRVEGCGVRRGIRGWHRVIVPSLPVLIGQGGVGWGIKYIVQIRMSRHRYPWSTNRDATCSRVST